MEKWCHFGILKISVILGLFNEKVRKGIKGIALMPVMGYTCKHIISGGTWGRPLRLRLRSEGP